MIGDCEPKALTKKEVMNTHVYGCLSQVIFLLKRQQKLLQMLQFPVQKSLDGIARGRMCKIRQIVSLGLPFN